MLEIKKILWYNLYKEKDSFCKNERGDYYDEYFI